MNNKSSLTLASKQIFSIVKLSIALVLLGLMASCLRTSAPETNLDSQAAGVEYHFGMENATIDLIDPLPGPGSSGKGTGKKTHTLSENGDTVDGATQLVGAENSLGQDITATNPVEITLDAFGEFTSNLARQGQKSIRFETPASDFFKDRREIQMPNNETVIGQAGCSGFSVYFPDSVSEYFAAPTEFFIFHQWKQNVSKSNPVIALALVDDPDANSTDDLKLKVSIVEGNIINGNEADKDDQIEIDWFDSMNSSSQDWLGGINEIILDRGEWHDFRTDWNIDPEGTNNYLKLWVNGTQVIDYDEDYIGHQGGSGSTDKINEKTGIYERLDSSSDSNEIGDGPGHVLYIDEFRQDDDATNCDEVDPAYYDPNDYLEDFIDDTYETTWTALASNSTTPVSWDEKTDFDGDGVLENNEYNWQPIDSTGNPSSLKQQQELVNIRAYYNGSEASSWSNYNYDVDLRTWGDGGVGTIFYMDSSAKDYYRLKIKPEDKNNSSTTCKIYIDKYVNSQRVTDWSPQSVTCENGPSGTIKTGNLINIKVKVTNGASDTKIEAWVKPSGSSSTPYYITKTDTSNFFSDGTVGFFHHSSSPTYFHFANVSF